MTTCVHCRKEIIQTSSKPVKYGHLHGSDGSHKAEIAQAAPVHAPKMTCPHDEQQCEYPRCLGDNPVYADPRCKARQAKADAQPQPSAQMADAPKEPWGFSGNLEVLPSVETQGMLLAETSGFEHAVDELAQKIIDENEGTSMSAAYRQVAKDLYGAIHSERVQTGANRTDESGVK